MSDKLEKKLSLLQKYKEQGFKTYVFSYSLAIAVGLSIGRLIMEKSISLLYFIMAFFLVAIIRFFLWRGIDNKIAAIEEELKTGQKVKAKLNKGLIIFIVFIALLLFFTQYHKDDILYYTYEKNASDTSIQTITIQNEEGIAQSFNIPNAYLQDLNLKLSPAYPSLNVGGYPRLSASLPDLNPYFLSKELHKVLKTLRRGKPYISDHTKVDSHYISFSIIAQNKSLSREAILDTYNKTIKGGLAAAKEETKHGLTIYKGKKPFLVKTEGKRRFYGFSNISLLIPQDKNDQSIQLFACEDSACIIIARLKNTNSLIVFNKRHLQQWQDIITKVETKIETFKTNS